MYVRERPCLEPGHGGCYPLPEPALEEGVVVAELWVAVAGEDLHAALVTPRPLLVTPGPALAPPTRHTQTGLSNTSNWDIFCHLLEERGKKWGNGGEDKTYFINADKHSCFADPETPFFIFTIIIWNRKGSDGDGQIVKLSSAEGSSSHLDRCLVIKVLAYGGKMMNGCRKS